MELEQKLKQQKIKQPPHFRIAEFDILFGKGISTTGCLLDLAEETNIVIRRGAWYSYEGENIGQGRDNTILWLDQNQEIKKTIEAIVKQKLTEGTEVSSNSMKQINTKKENISLTNDIQSVAQIYLASAGIHHPAAGPIKRTTIHNKIKQKIPTHPALILNLIN